MSDDGFWAGILVGWLGGWFALVVTFIVFGPSDEGTSKASLLKKVFALECQTMGMTPFDITAKGQKMCISADGSIHAYVEKK